MRTIFIILIVLLFVPLNRALASEDLNIRTVGSGVPRDEYGSYFPFRMNPARPYERYLGTQDTDVSFIINNRPVSYTPNKDVDYSQVERKINQALNIAQQGTVSASPVVVVTRPIEDIDRVRMAIAKAANPNLTISIDGTRVQILYKPQAVYHVDEDKVWETMSALAMLNYKKGAYPEAEKLLQQMIELKEKKLGKDSPEVARMADYLAMIYRADGDFDKAEATLLHSLSIKQRSLSEHDPALAASYMNLADLYYDMGPAYLSKAIKFRRKSETMMSAVGFTVPALPVPCQFSCPLFNNWKHLTDSADQIVGAKKDFEASNEAEIASIKALMKSLFPDEGGSYVYGTAQVPLDRSNSLVYKKVIAEQPESPDGKTEKVVHGGEKKISDLKDIPVVLCSAALLPAIDQVINTYAQKYGFSMSDYRKTWPGIREQAIEIAQSMSSAVEVNSVYERTTNALGEFEFKGVRKANKKAEKEAYCLFCYIVTSEKALYWSIPVDIDGKTPIRADILRDNAHILWEKNRVAPTAVASVPTQTNGGNGNGGVPPPPPMTPSVVP